MIIITIADIHGCVDENFLDKDVLETADAILLAGDITNFGNANQAAKVIDTLKTFNHNIVAVHGNCDTEGVEKYLKNNIYYIHNNIIKIDNIAFAGFGGTIPAYSHLEETLSKLGNKMQKAAPAVFLTHQPPYGTSIDRVSNSHYGGSPAINDFIEKYQPLAAFAGHIHESAGVSKIGETFIANPGPLSHCGYIFTEIDVENSKVLKCELRNFIKL